MKRGTPCHPNRSSPILVPANDCSLPAAKDTQLQFHVHRCQIGINPTAHPRVLEETGSWPICQEHKDHQSRGWLVSIICYFHLEGPRVSTTLPAALPLNVPLPRPPPFHVPLLHLPHEEWERVRPEWFEEQVQFVAAVVHFTSKGFCCGALFSGICICSLRLDHLIGIELLKCPEVTMGLYLTEWNQYSRSVSKTVVSGPVTIESCQKLTHGTRAPPPSSFLFFCFVLLFCATPPPLLPVVQDLPNV